MTTPRVCRVTSPDSRNTGDTSQNMVTCSFPDVFSEKTIHIQECSPMTYVHSSKDYDDTDMQVDLLSCLLKVP